MTCIYGACNGRNCLDCEEAEWIDKQESAGQRWEDLSPELRDMILRVSTGELTADEAADELRDQRKPPCVS